MSYYHPDKTGILEIRILKGRNISSSPLECSVTVGLSMEQFELTAEKSIIDLTGTFGEPVDMEDERSEDVDDGEFVYWKNILIMDIDLLSAYAFLRIFKKDGEEGDEIGSAWMPLAGLRKGKRQKSWWSIGMGEVQVGLLAVDFDKPIKVLNSHIDHLHQNVRNVQNIPSSQQYGKQNLNVQHQQQPQQVIIPHRREVAKYDSRFQTLDETHLLHYQPDEIHREYPHIARGSFGVVFKGHLDSMPNTTVVIKDLEIQNQNTLPEWQKELQVMAKNRTPYIAEVFGYSMNQNILTIVMEYMDKGSLYDFLHKKKTPASLVQRMRMSRHVALGLSVLHSNNIIHRDIKSMNILVNSELACKITDFGTAKFVSSSAHIMNTVNSGTPLWMAPEVKMGQYTFSADIYSLGLVMYEIFENELPYYDQTYQCVIIQPDFESASLVMPCLDQTPQRRPKANEVVIALDSTIRNIVTTAIPRLSDTERAMFKLDSTDPQVVEQTLAEVYRYLLGRDPDDADAIVGVISPLNRLSKSQGIPMQQQYAPQYQPQQQMQMQFAPQYQPQMQQFGMQPQMSYQQAPYY